ncbi:MAG: hypothetical protein RSA73_03260 [Anaerovoracaceae bacterium]
MDNNLNKEIRLIYTIQISTAVITLITMIYAGIVKAMAGGIGETSFWTEVGLWISFIAPITLCIIVREFRQTDLLEQDKVRKIIKSIGLLIVVFTLITIVMTIITIH